MSQPIYTTINSVKIRLTNKVQFQKQGEECARGAMPFELLCQIISDAETEVEQDLRGRYEVPFKSIRTGQYKDLPDHTQRAIRSVVDYWAVTMILDTDFGSGTHISGSSYSESTRGHYNSLIAKLLGRDQEANGGPHDRFRFTPPLEDLKLAASNCKADDGFRGRIINTDASENAETHAIESINNPSIRNLGYRNGY